jgi:FAD/FMN-containing dehydrogenase
VLIDHNGGGAIARMAADETVFAHRGWVFNFLISSIWADPQDTETNIAWTRGFMREMQPFAADAAYVNYLGPESDETVRHAYGTAYQRLVAVKDRYDPGNVFSLYQNVKPTAATV